MKLRFDEVSLPLSNFDLALNHEFEVKLVAILGPSGAGKTSLLEVLAGLRRPQRGRIVFGEEVLFDAAGHIWRPARHRQIGYVPQDLALFPHLNVRANISYGLRASEPEAKLRSICEVLEIDRLLTRMPANLSGGEKQRVAFARAILAQPRLLLLDEPLSSLDQALKERIFPYLQRMRDELAIPMLYVTHSKEEACALADHVLMMNSGRIVAQGLPADFAQWSES
jgi:molybdate transport system ATP-binding protein